MDRALIGMDVNYYELEPSPEMRDGWGIVAPIGNRVLSGKKFWLHQRYPMDCS